MPKGIGLSWNGLGVPKTGVGVAGWPEPKVERGGGATPSEPVEGPCANVSNPAGVGKVAGGEREEAAEQEGEGLDHERLVEYQTNRPGVGTLLDIPFTPDWKVVNVEAWPRPER